ncbi:MAG: hypothetical protein IT522_08890 [Burkholderiales bacterium]|nr:hypothetical protein [Burkholderiales bacterium]
MSARITRYARELAKLARRAGPYLALELILPGGTLFALTLYLYRSGHLRRLATRARLGSIAGAAAWSMRAFAFALQPAGSEVTARREDGLELALLAAR